MSRHKPITHSELTVWTTLYQEYDHWRECRCCGAQGFLRLTFGNCPCDHLDGGGWASSLGDYEYCGRPPYRKEREEEKQ